MSDAQRRAAAAVVVMVATLALGGPAAAIAAPTDGEVVVGDALPIEPGVELRVGEDAPYVPLGDVAPVAVGDGVRTDETGYAEVAYLDGSRTRLDVNTEFEVLELIDDIGVSTTRTRMDLGRTWHRVESLGEGEFTVETSQATASVRGTAFAVTCDAATRCSFLVADGSIELTLPDGSVVPVDGPAQVEVADGIAGAVAEVSSQQIAADPWLTGNVLRDVAAGHDDLTAILDGSAVAGGSASLPVDSLTTPDTSIAGTPLETPTVTGSSAAATTTSEVVPTTRVPAVSAPTTVAVTVAATTVAPGGDD